MLELIAQFGKFFCQTYTLAGVFLIGFLFINEKAFARILFIVTFTMVYTALLKSIWQMPLPPPLEGWAFPSGHMHTAFVFWGWLAIEYHKVWFYEITFFLLCLVGYGIVYHGYHYPIDILGAAGFGTLSLIIYSLLQHIKVFKEKPYWLGFLLAFLSGLIILILPPESRKPHVWIAFEVLVGFTILWALSFKIPNKRKKIKLA